MEITIVSLVILLILSLIRAKAYKASLKALADYYRNKGYPMPTDVELFQSIMKKMGYYKGEIDGKFGGLSEDACNAFQKDYPECGTNGQPDGSFGPKCWNKALSLIGA